MENPIKMDDLGVTIIFGNTQILWGQFFFKPHCFVHANFVLSIGLDGIFFFEIAEGFPVWLYGLGAACLMWG